MCIDAVGRTELRGWTEVLGCQHHLGKLIKHVDFKSPNDPYLSETQWPNLFAFSMSLPKKIEGLTVNGYLSRTKGEEVLGFFEHNLSTLFLLLLGLVLKGMQEKFSRK